MRGAPSLPVEVIYYTPYIRFLMTETRCILISLSDDVSELGDLARSLDMNVLDTFIQHREKPDPKYFIGSGKVEEILEFVNEMKVELAIINSSLKPSQLFTLEDYLGITVYDRIRLILEIFADRAHSEEARLQVELAKLEYEIPLLRDWIHKARYGERPGFMAGGEYEVAQYYEVSRKRIKKIKQKLRKIEKERDIRRKQRRYLGYDLISIVGYTNAGKSTLFNMIAGEKVAVENRLFTTLSTTTRKIPQLKRPILITDTVGFIDGLPHWLIEAFHSTLEEIFLSDVILLILDASEGIEEIQRKLKTSFEVLLPDLNPSKIILVLNKIDQIKTEMVGYEEDSSSINNNESNNLNQREDPYNKLINKIHIDYEIRDILPISALDPSYQDQIIESILRSIQYPKILFISIPNNREAQSFIAWLYTCCEIIAIDYKESIEIKLQHREKDEGKIKKRCEALGGQINPDPAAP
jgi:GTP-binding protein HflX